jgi:hypothetical protein
MDFLKKVLILSIFILVLYILFRLIKKRRELILHEGFATSYINPAVLSISSLNKIPNTITSMPDSYKNMPLYSVFIKASYNTAYDGNEVSTDMIDYILSRGYRFLDFEVYWETLTNAPDGSPTATVGVSEDGTNIRTSNNILLSEVFDKIQMSAFTQLSPNRDDPLFIQLRPMYQTTNDPTLKNTDAYMYNSQLNASIKQALGVFNPSHITNNMITPSTKLNKLCSTDSSKAKIIFIMDVSHINKGDDLLYRIHLKENVDVIDLEILSETESTPIKPTPKIQNNKITKLKPVDENNEILSINLNPYKAIAALKPNIMPIIGWLPSTNVVLFNNLGPSTLAQYEKLFIDNGNSAFIDLDSLYKKSIEATRLNSKIVAV